MKENKKTISVIMASYNSEATIGLSLKSIRRQDFPQDEIEILVIDGGSTDRTRNIAKHYGAKIIENPKRLPEPAKRIGLRQAVGEFALIMDSDEVLPRRDVFKRRVDFFSRHEDLVCILGGYIPPKNTSHFIRHSSFGKYISFVGDPFTAFVYQWYIGGNMGLIKEKDIYRDSDGYIGHFSDEDITPIGDSVTMFRRDHVLEHYDDLIDTENTSTIVEKIIRDTHIIGHVRNDYVRHYTKSDLHTYLNKLKFRVINNINDVNGSGYSSKVASGNSGSKLKYRKYLYPLYCLFLPLPVYDGIRMSLYYKDLSFLMHPFLAWYVLIEIVVNYGLKIIGKGEKNEQYG